MKKYTKVFKKINALFLVIIMIMTIIPISSVVVRAENGLPFEFESTDYGIEDENVTAQKLNFLNSNVSVFDDEYGDMLLLKEDIGSKVLVYIIGVSGKVVHTYEVDNDNSWLSEKRVVNRIMGVSGTSVLSTEYDSIYEIINPNTGKKDLINMTTENYYDYGFDEYKVINKYFIRYKSGSEYGYLDNHGKQNVKKTFNTSDYTLMIEKGYEHTKGNREYQKEACENAKSMYVYENGI